MRAIVEDRLTLDTPVGAWLENWRDAAHAGVSIRHLLDHSSGLPARARLFEHQQGRAAFEAAIAALPLEHAPGSSSVYSDLGFILLAMIAESRGGHSLDEQFDSIRSRLGVADPVLAREALAHDEVRDAVFATVRGLTRGARPACIDGRECTVAARTDEYIVVSTGRGRHSRAL
jgi:hypothetical protein